jgi:monoamine oxidase
VRAVRWTPGGVTVDAEHRGARTYHRARALVVTVPLGVLQARPGDASAIAFEPPLEGKQRALAGLAMGPALRVSLQFGGPFWEALEHGRWRDASFFHTTEPPFRTFWTALPERRSRLTAWAGGPPAAALCREPHDAVVGSALRCLQSIFGKRVDVAGLLRKTRLHDWQRDAHALGAYSYVTVGGGGTRRLLAEPVGSTLFFAGEATDDTGEAGTVAGAILSGRRAADEVLAGWPQGAGVKAM